MQQLTRNRSVDHKIASICTQYADINFIPIVFFTILRNFRDFVVIFKRFIEFTRNELFELLGKLISDEVSSTFFYAKRVDDERKKT